jgi:hypothetical protein
MTASTSELTTAARDADDVNLHSSRARPLPTWRVNVMRLGYLVMAVGLTLRKGPLFVDGTVATLPVYEGVVAALLGTMALLALLGLRYPIQLLPLLVFESVWKLIWLAAVAAPHVMSGDMSTQMSSVLSSVSVVVLILAVTPWDYVWSRYVRASGDPWR